MEKNVTGNIIELKGITKRYEDNFTAVEDFNLEVRKGEFVTFLGPSGCGKTTTLRMIAGFDIPTEGKILLNGEDISKLPPNKRPINTVFQRYALFPHLNIFDNIAFGLKIQKVSKSEIKNRVEELIELVGLKGMEKRYPNQLSGGQRQRLTIARALVARPKILILDDSSSALDFATDARLRKALEKMRRSDALTTVTVSQRAAGVRHCDIIVVMDDGAISATGTHEQLISSSELYREICLSQNKEDELK